MLDWDDLRYFLAIHRTGSLAGAAASLGINPTTVGRRLAALEERAETRLFDRTPDGYLVTATGQALLPRAERMEVEALGVEREIAGADRRVAGVVRVTATEMLATRFLTPHLPAFAARYPELALDLVCTHAIVSLARREADVALRLARPREPDLVVRRLAAIEVALYASRGYLARAGAPAAPDAPGGLAGHDVLGFASTPSFRLENAWFDPRAAGARVVLRSDSVSSIFAVTLAGLGIGLLPRVVADREPELARIPTPSAPEPRVIWQAVHLDLKGNARIRAVVDWLAEILAPPGDAGA